MPLISTKDARAAFVHYTILLFVRARPWRGRTCPAPEALPPAGLFLSNRHKKHFLKPSALYIYIGASGSAVLPLFFSRPIKQDCEVNKMQAVFLWIV
ncbi:MAG: hypothetical protein MR935_06055 [Agathobaculum sp.]|nr:hypothetical protein [Agathobaculum sp.]